MFSNSNSTSKASSKATSRAASTHSTISTAPTLNGADISKNHKWYSLSRSSKTGPSHNAATLEKKRLHNEALAGYFSMR
ncbi:uncharacterized protein N7515_000253 [Penicillium bovifimosum]|uniref:Uncharacterized protein n=1 Tax=Penicillium bovifimosum TaxID=126998 RepID=A0A9W9L9R4_9EURO|nr:uncharacterized protein N7515_000253 [Penicillium bovifimosum]KAJ5145689.1 hypothetical protein N7515_000253 [Penicillium bovifimosum]